MRLLSLLMGCFVFQTIQAQTIKILFDATSAETAGSADWVIDADQHNIGYPSGPAVIGSGNESNPQKIPNPLQSGINGSTAENYWTGALSSWGIDLVQYGYMVETLPYNGQITYGNVGNTQDLTNYDVFIICEPNIVFTAAEKTAIMNFIQNGGGVFMVSDHDVSDRNGDGWDSPHIWNDLITNNSVQNNAFGFIFDYVNISETSTNIPSLPADSILHGPYGNVSEVMWSNGTTMTLDPAQNSSVKGVVYKTGSSFGNNNVMVAYARYGTGKVAAIGDSSPADDGSGDPNDFLYDGWITDAAGNHERLIMNMTIWLADQGTASGINNEVSENIRVFPNPAQEYIMIESQYLEPLEFSLYDLSGKKIEICQLNNSLYRFNLDNKNPGMYFYIISDGAQIIQHGKLLKQ